MRKYLIVSSFCLLAIVSLYGQEKQYKVGCVGFYNLENLFDTINSPDTEDEEFLPSGNKGWTGKRYREKLKNMSDIISRLGVEYVPAGPSVFGVCEIENRSVLKDLVQMPKLKKRNYKIVHEQSPDERGVDVGLLYQPDVFKVLGYRAVHVDLPEDEGEDENYTRDVLLVSGLFDGEKMHFLVNHWPSRYGGEKRSRPLRNKAAKVARGLIDSIFKFESRAKIILMGDLNDNPDNESVFKYLKAKETKQIKDDELYNPMAKRYKKGIGTTAYRDVWSLFDQIIVSKSLLDDSNGYSYYKTIIFKENSMLQQKGRFKGYPKRTFAGGRYLGGYSDHFPVYMFLVKEH